MRGSCFRQLQRWLGNLVGELSCAQYSSLRTPAGWQPPIIVYRCRNGTRIGAKPALAAILISALLTGCVTPPNARTDLLSFFELGKTTREEVLLSLGQPSASFEQERIFTYRIGQYGEEGYYIISPKVVLPAQAASWQNVRFSLVIVFDEQGRLRKHQLVRVD